MTKDEEMWGRWYNKEEEEAKIWAGIKYEVMENVAKGKVDSGIEKEIFDELKSQIEKDGHNQGYAEGHAKGCAEGRDQGIAEGRAEGHREFIQTMIENGISISEISSMIKMSEEEIHKILNV